MLFTDFYWDCPSCKKMNWESLANEDDPYKCRGCKRKFYLTFSVEVEEIERYDEEADQIVSVQMTEIGVSCDSGKTWERKVVDTRDLNPTTSMIKPGEWIEHNGEIRRVHLNEKHNRLQTTKIGFLPKAIEPNEQPNEVAAEGR